MIVQIQPSSITGAILAPASKSSMQRACAAALVAARKCVIANPGHSNDDRAALDIVRRLGAIVTEEPQTTIVESSGVRPIATAVDCGESGLSIRMFTPLVALSERPITVTGSGSLATRPMDFFDTVLPQLGVSISSSAGKLPLQIKGPLQPRDIEIDGSLSSQFLTGLLMAYAAAGASNVSITVRNLKSKPYVDLTLKVMKDFGLQVPLNHNYERFEFIGSDQPSTASIHYQVEGDWSGGAFLLVAGAIAGPITVKGLDLSSTQADRAVLSALIDSGCALSIQDAQIEVGPGAGKPFHFNATDCPDLFPPLVALAAYSKGKSVIEGVSRLTHKESNRALTLQEEFARFGIAIQLQDDLMIVNGTGILHGAATHSHHDHRIAMACAVAALKANGETSIEEAGAINKSYPDFYDHLRSLGATVNSTNFQTT